MNRTMEVPSAASPQGAKAGIRRRILTQVAVKVLVLVLLVLGLAGTTLAMDQPPATAPQQRAWLLSHLVTDMQSVGSFTSGDVAQMVSLVNTLSDDQVSLLARFYYLTREKTEQDAQLYAVQQTGTPDALAQAQAQVASLLAQLQNQIQQTYAELAAVNLGCGTLCQVAYASVPGWCAYNQYAIPDGYYNNGCYVGPAYSAGYCGVYGPGVYNSFYNRGSRYNFWNSRAYIHHNIAGIARVYGRPLGPVVTAHHVAAPAIGHANPRFHTPAAVVRKHAVAPAVRHVQHAVAHSHPKPAAHPKAHVKAHVAHTKAHVAHAQHAVHHAAHVQHVAHHAAHAQHAAHHAAHASGHGRHK